MIIELFETSSFKENEKREIAKNLSFCKECKYCGSLAKPIAIKPMRIGNKISISWYGTDTFIFCSKGCISSYNNIKIAKKNPSSYKERGIKSGNTQRGSTWDKIYGEDKSNIMKAALKEEMISNNFRWSLKYRTAEEIEHQKNINRSSLNNPFSIVNARKNYDDRYGAEKSKEIRKKISIKNSGENNAMYGKSVSIYSGAGTKGWYNEIMFRSLIECSYIHKCVTNGIKIKSAETKDFWVEYNNNGTKRIYRPDFYIEETDTVIEIKHSRFVNTEENQNKFKAAKQKFNKFIVLTEKDISYIKRNEFKKLLDEKCIKLL